MSRRTVVTSSILIGFLVTAATFAPFAAAAGTSDVTALGCGYSSNSNTFKPVATVLRTAIGGEALDPNDRRMAVAMFLLDGTTQLASLGTGLAGSGVNGTVQVPLGETRDFSPELGAVFGDGSVGGSALSLDHAYTIRVRVIDFTTDFTPDFFLFTCVTSSSPPLDSDSDLVNDDFDNCPATPNPDQSDTDVGGEGDGIGDVCDDTDSDGFGDAVEEGYGSLWNDSSSTPVVPPGWISDPMGPWQEPRCDLVAIGPNEDGESTTINPCGLEPGDVLLSRNLGGFSLIEQLADTHFTHSYIVVGRLDLEPEDADPFLDVVIADVTPRGDGSVKTDQSLYPFLAINDEFEGLDAFGVYRPALSRAEREGAARAALANLWANGASAVTQRHSLWWNAPSAEYGFVPGSGPIPAVDPTALGPTRWYCSSYVAAAYGSLFSPPLELPWWIPGLVPNPDTLYITPDDLIDGLPGMQLINGFNTDGGLITIWSPAHIMLVDPQGRRTGMDADGNLHEEIPGALWRLSPYNESISAAAMADNWSVEVTGYASGEYALVHTRVGEQISEVGMPGFTRIGQHEVYTVGEVGELEGRPVAVDDSATTKAGLTVVIPVLENDIDLDGDLEAGSLAIADPPDHGSATVSGDAIRYSPSDGFSGSDRLAYGVCDTSGSCATGLVSINVEEISLTTVNYTGAATVQYSDAASLSGHLAEQGSGNPIPSKTLDFTLGAQTTSAGPTDASGNASTSLVVTQTPGSVSSVQTAFASDAGFGPSSDSDLFQVAREDCTLAYAGDTLVNAANMTNLRAQLGELDASPGDWSGKQVTFTVTDAAQVAQTFTATTDGTGLASTQAALGADVYGVSASFGGDDFYLGCQTAADTLVTVESAVAKITGGGFVAQTSGNTYFGFNVIPDVTGLHGQLQIRSKGGKNKFHSTTVLTLSSGGNTGTWTGTGRWNGTDGYSFTVAVVDNGSSGKKKGDTISIVIKSSTNVIVFTTNGPQPLKGGNIAVH